MLKEEKINLSELNSAQEDAVRHISGPSLIIAGAGSGKTKVVTYKIAYLLENGVEPNSILSLTFTNKAAKEMKERISLLVGKRKGDRLWMGTFHSIFIRFLRENADKLGFPSSFTIYDSGDSRTAISACIKELQLDDKIYKPKDVQSRISNAKNNLVTANSYMNNATAIQNDMAAKKERICDIYSMYAKKCKDSGVMDFDDILLYMNILLRDFPEVCDNLMNRFSHIFVDEYQDTNFAQYLIIKKLSNIHRNLTVVGDDSQSIYAFRGARIQNILNFKKDYPEAREFKLEQNYRSTQTIVQAANSLINKNSNRLKKDCFSKGDIGENIELIKAFTEQDEGNLVASSILSRIHQDKSSYQDFAVLYRTNAQSRAVEESLRKKNVPYKIYAGHSFYERAEVKDMLAYLRLIVNHKDDEAFKRIVNVPARGIGSTSLKYLSDAAKAKELPLFDVLNIDGLEEFGLKSAALTKFKAFKQLIESISAKKEDTDAYTLALEIANYSGIISSLKNDPSIESQNRLQNVEELLNSVKEFVENINNSDEDVQDSDEDVISIEDEFVSLESYLENVALVSDSDEDSQEDNNKVKLMTIHSSKGLEFSHIYIIGMEDNLFPSLSSLSSPDELEEERRLFYVALTRAKKTIALSYSKSRFRWGQHVSYPISKFLKEIDPIYIDGTIDEESSQIDISNNYQSRYGGFQKNNKVETTKSFVPKHSVPVRQPDPNFTASPISDLKVGQEVEHDRFGNGKIISIEGTMPNLKAIVKFDVGGEKTLLLKFAKLKVLKK